MARQRKNKRTPLGKIRRKLSFDNQDKDYQYRWVNDNDMRISDAVDGGYEFVEREDGDHAGDVDAANTDDGMGRRISKVVNKNGTRAFLMRIKKEWFEEDQAEKQKVPDAIEDQIRNRNDEFAQKLGKNVRGKVEIG